MDHEIDLRDIFGVLWKNRLLIVGIFCVAVVAAGAISYAIPPVYRISCIVDLGNFGDPIYTTQSSANEIMQSEGFISDAIDQLNISLSPSKFKGITDSLKITPVKDSDRLLMVSFDTRNPRDEKRIVEEIVRLFASRSNESYIEAKTILDDQLASTQERLASVEERINQTREALENLEKAQGSSQVEDELRVSRTLDLLSSEDSRRSALVDRYLDLQKQLDLLKPMELVQPPKMPIAPIWPQRLVIVTVAGTLGLMVGILAAFLREGLRSPDE
jgi:uncharacterized protein involved in exopolysaccharide biosynthesis